VTTREDCGVPVLRLVEDGHDDTTARTAQVTALLAGIEWPEDGVVLRATWDDVHPALSDRQRWALLRLVHAAMYPITTYESRGPDGRWATAHQITREVWCVRYVDHAGIDVRLFREAGDAVDWYSTTVLGQADATSGRAWETTDVAGILCGPDLRLALRHGYAYEDLVSRYARDPDGTVAALRTLDALAGRP
jgi:hypothetical protein